MQNVKPVEIFRYFGFGIFAFFALLLFFLQPLGPALGELGQQTLAGTLITIGIWIFKPWKLSYSIGGCFLMSYLLTMGLAPGAIFVGFTTSALWTLIPALFFGYVLLKTGLGKRIAMAVLHLCKPKYPAMLFAWVIIGIALSMLTPSITVRVGIIIPIAVYYCMLFGLDKDEKANSLILLTAFAMALLPGSGWLTGSLWGPIIQGLFEATPETTGLITFQSWWQVNLLPMALTTFFLVIFGYFALKPKYKPIKAKGAEEEKLLPMSREEKASGLILLGAFLLFLTNNWHPIPDAAVCLLALVLLFAFGVLEAKEFSTGINWDLVCFIGFSLSLGSIFAATGISEWLTGIIIPFFAPIAGNPWLFVYGTVIFLFLWRFIDVALLMPTMALLVPTLPGIAAAYGIHPLVWITIFVMAGNTFILSYQNMWALMSQSIAGKNAWKNRHLATFGILYFLACLLALAAAIPLWIKMGLL